jgi:tetratricopeptide (TPR) repeat protein
MELDRRLSSALGFAASGNLNRAKEAYLDLIDKAEALSQNEGSGRNLQAMLAQALNNLAWMLVTSQDNRVWKPGEALSYAKRAVKIAAHEGNYWNTLGVAWFRLEDWTEATEAFEQSMKLRNGGQGDGYDWFFLAMIEARRGRKEQGRQWYERAVAATQQADQFNPELFRFQVEAAATLGLERPVEPPTAQGFDQLPNPLRPNPVLRPRIRRDVRLGASEL